MFGLFIGQADQQKLVVRPHLNWGPRISAIPIASTAGLLDVGIYRGNVNSDVFLDFAHDHLATNVSLFNGINPTRSLQWVSSVAPEKMRIGLTRPVDYYFEILFIVNIS